MGLKIKAVALVVVCFSGCASLSEIRSNEPYYTLTSIKPPEELAKCIEQRIRAETGGRWYEANLVVNREDYPNHTYRIGLTLPGYTAMADILVKPSDKGSLVEYRRKGWFTGESSALEEIKRCAE